MAGQNRWNQDREAAGPYGDRAQRGYRDYGRARDYGADDLERGEDRSFSDEDREFNTGRSYSDSDDGYGRAEDSRYGGRWGRGEGGYGGDRGQASGSQGYGGYGIESARGRFEGSRHRGPPNRAESRGYDSSSVASGEGRYRGRGPKNYARSDERIQEDVNDRLTEDAWLDASEIEVVVANGEVTLSGTVETRRDRRRAEDLVEQVSGVRHVQNNLRPQLAAGQPARSATA